MSITHNQFKNIEAKVFSPEVHDLNVKQLLNLKQELTATHNDSKQDNQILERWNAVDAKLSSLITDERAPAYKWFLEKFWFPLLLVIIGAVISISYDQYKAQNSTPIAPANNLEKPNH